MESLIQAIEVFALVTGIAYVVLEILQKNAMWVLGVLTSAACAFSFSVQQVWASMGLNIYYLVVSVLGFIRWRQDSQAVEEGEIHLRILPRRTLVWSAVLAVAGTAGLYYLLRATGDSAPALDAAATMLSVIATWWLTRSYLQQWLLFIVADILTTLLCVNTGQHWMALLYLAYIGSAIYGYFHWKKRGKVVNLPT